METPGPVADHQLAQFAAALRRVEAKLDQALEPKPVRSVLTFRETMPLIGAKSASAAHRILGALKIRPLPGLRGKYRRMEIENAVARRALRLPGPDRAPTLDDAAAGLDPKAAVEAG